MLFKPYGETKILLYNPGRKSPRWNSQTVYMSCSSMLVGIWLTQTYTRKQKHLWKLLYVKESSFYTRKFSFPLRLSSCHYFFRISSYFSSYVFLIRVFYKMYLKNIKQGNVCIIKVRLHTAINRADFVSWCMLYTYDGNKMHSWENDAVLLLAEPLNHIHQDTKPVRLIAVCKRSLWCIIKH